MGFATKAKRLSEDGVLNSNLKAVEPPAIHNPYLAARREWDERYGDLVSQGTKLENDRRPLCAHCAGREWRDGMALDQISCSPIRGGD